MRELTQAQLWQLYTYWSRQERYRIIKQLEAQIQRTNTSNVDELAGLFSAIALIKGEQK